MKLTDRITIELSNEEVQKILNKENFCIRKKGVLANGNEYRIIIYSSINETPYITINIANSLSMGLLDAKTYYMELLIEKDLPTTTYILKDNSSILISVIHDKIELTKELCKKKSAFISNCKYRSNYLISLIAHSDFSNEDELCDVLFMYSCDKNYYNCSEILKEKLIYYGYDEVSYRDITNIRLKQIMRTAFLKLYNNIDLDNYKIDGLICLYNDYLFSKFNIKNT